MKQTLNLEISRDGQWESMGDVNLREDASLGLNAKTEFVYNLDYATRNLDHRDERAVSCLMPVSFEPYEFDGWPPFLLDLFPQGAALRYVVDHYRIQDRPENYWQIICTAPMNPPGNLRVLVTTRGPLPRDEYIKHPGFSRAEVIAKGPGFLDYMIEHGAPVTGTTGAGGAAPKFLLRESVGGRFFADGVLPDQETRQCWLVKFPRSSGTRDREILRTEKHYLDLAGTLGMNLFAPAIWEDHCLFIPRFDRPRLDQKIAYLGMESFYSMIGKPEFGSRHRHETYVQALASVSTQSDIDVMEYVLRDFLNIMLGNTDNHGRNSSLIKYHGAIRLAPLYDLAPMMFDPEGIVRNTRWEFENDEDLVKNIADFLAKHCNIPHLTFKRQLQKFFMGAQNLQNNLEKLGIPPEFLAGTQADRDRLLQKIAAYLKD